MDNTLSISLYCQPCLRVGQGAKVFVLEEPIRRAAAVKPSDSVSVRRADEQGQLRNAVSLKHWYSVTNKLPLLLIIFFFTVRSPCRPSLPLHSTSTRVYLDAAASCSAVTGKSWKKNIKEGQESENLLLPDSASNVKYVIMLLRFKQQKMNTRGEK